MKRGKGQYKSNITFTTFPSTSYHKGIGTNVNTNSYKV